MFYQQNDFNVKNKLIFFQILKAGCVSISEIHLFSSAHDNNIMIQLTIERKSIFNKNIRCDVTKMIKIMILSKNKILNSTSDMF